MTRNLPDMAASLAITRSQLDLPMLGFPMARAEGTSPVSGSWSRILISAPSSTYSPTAIVPVFGARLARDGKALPV